MKLWGLHRKFNRKPDLDGGLDDAGEDKGKGNKELGTGVRGGPVFRVGQPTMWKGIGNYQGESGKRGSENGSSKKPSPDKQGWNKPQEGSCDRGSKTQSERRNGRH